MKSIPLHRVAVVSPFTNFLADVGAPFERGFRQAGLPVCALEDVNNFIPSHRFWRFLVDMARGQDIPDLGFHVGQQYGANCADPHLIDLLHRAPTLYRGLIKATKLINSTVTNCTVGLFQPPHSRHTHFYHQPSCDAANPAIEQIGWYGIMTLIGMVRESTGPQWQPSEIGVMVNHPPSRFIREQFANTTIRLAQPYSYIALDNAQLGLPPLNLQNKLSTDFGPHYEALAQDFVGTFKQLIHAYIFEENLSVEFLAGASDISKRSLQRRLTRTGTSYSEVLDQVRFETAKRMLQDGGMSITDISQRLGYSDATHFSRAFRRVVGVAPNLYRQQSLQ